MAELNVASDEVMRILNVLDGTSTPDNRAKQIPGIRMFSRSASSWTNNVTLMGRGWTLNFTVISEPRSYRATHERSITGMAFYGDRDRFDEDFVLAKMLV
jgi:hypothetical protein